MCVMHAEGNHPVENGLRFLSARVWRLSCPGERAGAEILKRMDL